MDTLHPGSPLVPMGNVEVVRLSPRAMQTCRVSFLGLFPTNGHTGHTQGLWLFLTASLLRFLFLADLCLSPSYSSRSHGNLHQMRAIKQGTTHTDLGTLRDH